jgi:hypothetical protein
MPGIRLNRFAVGGCAVNVLLNPSSGVNRGHAAGAWEYIRYNMLQKHMTIALAAKWEIAVNLSRTRLPLARPTVILWV